MREQPTDVLLADVRVNERPFGAVVLLLLEAKINFPVSQPAMKEKKKKDKMRRCRNTKRTESACSMSWNIGVIPEPPAMAIPCSRVEGL